MFSISSTPSIITQLAKQRAIAQKNDLIFAGLKNRQAQRELLKNTSYTDDFDYVSQMENDLTLEQCLNDALLMHVCGEIDVLNQLDYFA